VSSVDVASQIVIQRPRDEVAAYAADPSNAPAWYVNIRSVEWESAPLLRVGARMTFVAQFLGRRLRYTYEIAEFEPGSALTMRTAQGPFPMETRYTWEAVEPGSTRMTLRNRGTPSGFSALVAPILVPAMRRANRKDLERLRGLLEPARPVILRTPTS